MVRYHLNVNVRDTIRSREEEKGINGIREPSSIQGEQGNVYTHN